MGRLCTGIYDGLVDWFSIPLHRPSETEVGLCGSWQKMGRVLFRSSLKRFVPPYTGSP